MNQQATLKTVYRLWWPLAMTWLMMAIEGPFLAAIIARMGESATNLAAYGVAYAFGLITEAPVIMLLSASTLLARSRCDYLRLRSFSVILCGIVTLFLFLLLRVLVAGVIMIRQVGQVGFQITQNVRTVTRIEILPVFGLKTIG